MRISDWSSDVCSSDLGGTTLCGEVAWMMKRLKHPKVRQASQIRASVIAEWTRRHDVRIVQYMSGHKYVSSRSEEHTSELQSLMRISYAVFSLNKNNPQHRHHNDNHKLHIKNTT